jgi:phosphatidylglycerophosphatase A
VGYHVPRNVAIVKGRHLPANVLKRLCRHAMFRSVNAVAKGIATALGAGYSPVAPGTCGTIVAIPLALLLASLPAWQFAAVTTALTAVAIWAAARADRAWGTHDSGRIVIDEVVGYLFTVTLVDRSSAVPLAVGFVVFRALDILKPPPIRWLDENLPGGFGVVLDDVAAGLIGMAILVGLDRGGALGWLAGL